MPIRGVRPRSLPYGAVQREDAPSWCKESVAVRGLVGAVSVTHCIKITILIGTRNAQDTRHSLNLPIISPQEDSMRTSPSPRSLVSALAVAALLPTAALAQTPPAATPPAPDYTFTANAGLFSEYIFRGISQTAGKPAVQGGFDWAHSNGFYLGTWGSNISWLEDFGAYTRSSLEWDFYGGYKANFPGSEDWSYDVGTHLLSLPGQSQSRFRQCQHLGNLRRAQLEVARRQGFVQPRRLLRCATHREEDRRHLVFRLLRQLSDRRHGVHAARALRDPQRQ